MKKISFIIFICAFLTAFSLSVFAQIPNATPIENDNDVVKISTTLIQLDLIVTDKKGNQVTDLKPEDFEIYENGKKQEITNFSYIFSKSNESPDSANVRQSPKNNEKLSVPPPPGKLRLEKINRTYAIVVDDLGLSFENVGWVQKSLRSFINDQMQDGDLVAIIRTGSGVGALQSFTNDKNQLLAAVNKLRWNPQGRGGISSFEAIKSDFKDDLSGMAKADGTVKNPAGREADKEFQDQIEEFRSENFSYGTLGALNYIIRGMRELPGRKSLMLISEGFPMIHDKQPTRVFDSMKVLADLANRSSVVIYTLDPRGLLSPGAATAEDDFGDVKVGDFGPKYDPIGDKLTARNDAFNDTVQSLRYIAYQTGGIPFVNQNNIGIGLREVLKDQNGYYLIGYQPDSDTFDPKKNNYNKLSIRIKREGLIVRHRSGFYGVTDKKMAEIKQTPQQKIAAALISPFGADEINLDLYSIFYNDSRNRSYLRSLLYIDPKDLTFTAEADGFHQTKFNIVAGVFDSNGASADNRINAQTLKLNDKQFALVQEKGIIYDLPVPVIKPGAYQFRVALEDTATGKIGAASQFIEIPNLDKKKLTLSNLILKKYSLEEWRKISLGESGALNSSDNSALLDSVSRKFKTGTIVTYSFVIYNAKTGAGQKPRLQLQTRLFRDGKPFMEGKLTDINVDGQTDPQRIEFTNMIRLGTELQTGSYALQIIVTDVLNADRKQIAAQSVAFEVIK